MHFNSSANEKISLNKTQFSLVRLGKKNWKEMKGYIPEKVIPFLDNS